MKVINVVDIFSRWEQIFSEQKEELTYLDGVAGDADLGIVMADGFRAVYELVKESEEKDLGKLFYAVGKQFNRVAPSSMGTLLASGFMNVGKRLKGVHEFQQYHIVDLLDGMAEGVANVGHALEGEKTFLDAMYPAVRAAKEYSEESFAVMMKNVEVDAKKGMERATTMVAKHGRIACRGKDSIGIVDPGTVVACLFVKGISEQ